MNDKSADRERRASDSANKSKTPKSARHSQASSASDNTSPQTGQSEISSSVADGPAGMVDAMTAQELAGWAWDPEQPNEPITVEILQDDRLLVTVVADLYRPDLEEAGVGDGRHGFVVRQIGRLLPGLVHQLRVRRAKDQRELSKSPNWIINPTGQLGSSGQKLLVDLAMAAVDTGDGPEELEQILSLFVACTRRVLQRRKLLSSSTSGPPASGMLEAIRQEYPELKFSVSSSPRVSVIIPAFNNFNLTYHCLQSIEANASSNSFELLVVDDGSTDETALANIVLPESVIVERLKSNSGFIAACNRGAQLARGEFLLFLNNDTLVQAGWLDELVATFERSKDVGIVGSQLLFEDGKVQDTGGLVWRLGDAWNWGRGADADDPRLRYMRDVDYVSGAALMIRKDLFFSLGGFDSYYAPAYYEDTDLAFRVRDAGKRVVLQPASRIIHLEGSTAGTDPSAPGVKRYQTVNQAKFYERWRTKLLRHQMNGQNAEQEAERSVTRRAYFIDDCVPTPDIDAGSNVAFQHMLALIDLGYKVTFLPADNMARHDPYTAMLEKYGIECVHAPFCKSAEQLLRESRPPPDLIFIHRFANAEKYAGMARVYFPRVKIIYSIADLHFLRLEREAKIVNSRQTALEAELIKERELAVMQKVDGVVAHSPHEADLIKKEKPATNVRVLGWAVPLHELKTPIDRRYGIAFVGGYQHRPNVDAALHLFNEIMPLIRAEGLPIRCYLGGSRMPQEVKGLCAPDVEIVGYVADLANLFEKVRCAVAPLRYGAGVKGKVLDSFSFGLPCVMSDVAAEGLDLPAELSWLVARSSKEFAQKVVALHREDGLAIRLGDAARAYVRDRCAFDVVRDQLAQILAATKAIRPATLPGGC
jgi:O-antigen biosynthesis protein